MQPVSDPLAVTLIGGYLGSGKTTLVNHLLRHANGLKLAVLVNEFGQLPIDADLIEAQDEELISIAGGCICCSYGDDMLEGIQQLRDRTPRPDHLIIEASGVAMPQAVAAAMTLVRGVSLHSVLVMGDAETLSDRSVDKYMGDTITRQLSSADLVILNRCDLATAQQHADALAVINKHAPGVVIIETRFANLPVTALLDKPSSDGASLPEYVAKQTADGPTHARFDSVFVKCPAPVDIKALGHLLSKAVSGVVRAKGFVVDQEADGCVFQLSGQRVTIEKRESDEIRLAGIVVIGVLPLFDKHKLLHEVRSVFR